MGEGTEGRGEWKKGKGRGEQRISKNIKEKKEGRDKLELERARLKVLEREIKRLREEAEEGGAAGDGMEGRE